MNYLTQQYRWPVWQHKSTRAGSLDTEVHSYILRSYFRECIRRNQARSGEHVIFAHVGDAATVAVTVSEMPEQLALCNASIREVLLKSAAAAAAVAAAAPPPRKAGVPGRTAGAPVPALAKAPAAV